MKEQPSYDEENGYTHIARYCMIAPDEEELFDSDNSVVSSSSS